MAATPAGAFNPTTYASATNAEGFTLGQKMEYQGSEYRFCKNAADAALLSGECLVRASATAWTATACNGASQISVLAVVGVAVVAVPVNYYFWALVDGPFVVVDTNNAAIIGQAFNPAAATKGALRIMSSVTHPPMGYCLATAAGAAAPTLCMVKVLG